MIQTNNPCKPPVDAINRGLTIAVSDVKKLDVHQKYQFLIKCLC